MTEQRHEDVAARILAIVERQMDAIDRVLAVIGEPKVEESVPRDIDALRDILTRRIDAISAARLDAIDSGRH